VSRTARLALIAAIAVACVGCDQATKHLARSTLATADPIPLLAGLLHLELTENRGGFLSLGANLPEPIRRGVFHVGVPALLVALVVAAVRAGRLRRAQIVGLALLLGGGAGNAIDRLARDGAVTDFVRVSLGPVSTGIFNFGDVAIAIGVILFALPAEDRAPDPPKPPL